MRIRALLPMLVRLVGLSGLALWTTGPLAGQDFESHLFPVPAEGSETPVPLSTDCGPIAPDLAGLTGGGFVAAWTNDLGELWARRLGRKGEAVGFEQPEQHSVVLTGPGEATVSWTRYVLSFPLIFQPPCSSNILLFSIRFRWAGERILLLRGGRFRVEVEWQDPTSGGSGTGRAIPDSEESGGFWFFEPDNTELRVKLIDGRAVNGHFWFFAGALTRVGYRITVTDQRTGISKTYDNPPGAQAGVTDTFAFGSP